MERNCTQSLSWLKGKSGGIGNCAEYHILSHVTIYEVFESKYTGYLQILS